MEDRALVVLSNYVQNYNFVDKRPYRRVKCGRKEAYGCGSNGDGIVKGLALYVRLGRDDDPMNSPDLSLSATDEVFRLVGSELDVEKTELYGSDTSLCTRIYTVDGDVMVLCITFVPNFLGAEVSYYLVYDSAAASLFLLPCRATCCQPVCTEFPLKVEVAGEQDKYSLVLMAERSEYKEPVLCLWSPPPSPDDNRRDDYSRCAWDLKVRVRVNAMANPFEAHVVFSFKGNAVWGDLAQGILYCDCRDLIDGLEPVDFKHILLPEECRSTSDTDDDQDTMPVFRNMGCVGDSIWFVIIEPSFDRPGGTKVKVWTLDLLSDEEWNLHTVFSMQSLWNLQLFRAMGLPNTIPEFPILSPQRDDCAMYMFLREPYRVGEPCRGGEPYAHLVCIDLSSAYKVRLLSRKLITMPLLERPILLDPTFFNLGHKGV